MYDVLVDIHRKVYGQDPTEANPLHIRAWVITHEHWDHQMVFYNFCKEYGKYKTVLIDRLFYNPASNEETYNCYKVKTMRYTPSGSGALCTLADSSL